MRLKDRVAIVVGAGQSPGEGIGNGRATVDAGLGYAVLIVNAGGVEVRDLFGRRPPKRRRDAQS